MSYQFLDGTQVRADTGPPPTPEQRIQWLEQRVADLEQMLIEITRHPALSIPPLEFRNA
jgi:hypothetical protein